MKEKLLLMIAAVGLLLAATGCSGSANNEVEGIPFQETEDGNWGMLSIDGKKIFSEEFCSKPTVVRNGRFLVKNAEDNWEIYTAEAKPQKVGGEYLQAGEFFCDVTPVVEKGKPIQFINTDGEVVVTFDKVGGRSVEWCSNFSEGLAVFRVGDLSGVVDTKGNVVVEPKYDLIYPCEEGRMLALEKGQKDLNDEERTFVVLSSGGKEVSRLKNNKYQINSIAFSGGTLVVYRSGENGNSEYGTIDEKGEYVIKPSSRFHSLFIQKGGHHVYYDGDSYGLVDSKGEVVIRAKYRSIAFVADDLLAVRKNGEDRWTLVNINGEEVSDESFLDVSKFYSSGLAWAQVSEHAYLFIDNKGKEVHGTDVYNISYSSGDGSFESDYVDMKALVESLEIKKEGSLMGFTLGEKPADVLKKLENMPKQPYTNFSMEPKAYQGNTTISVDLKKIGLPVEFYAVCLDYIVKPITERYGSGWFSYTKTIGYEFTNVTTMAVSLKFRDAGKFKGKLSELFNTLKEHTVAFGNQKIIDDTSFIVPLENNTRLRVSYDDYLDLRLEYAEEEVVSGKDVFSSEEEDYGELESPPADGL